MIYRSPFYGAAGNLFFPLWRVLLCPQALPGNEFRRPEQHDEQTPAGLAESWDATEPERLERGGTVQLLLQLTLQVRDPPCCQTHTHTHTHTLTITLTLNYVKRSMQSRQKPPAKQFTHLSILRSSVCKQSKKNVGWLHSEVGGHLSGWTFWVQSRCESKCSSHSWCEVSFSKLRREQIIPEGIWNVNQYM